MLQVLQVVAPVDDRSVKNLVEVIENTTLDKRTFNMLVSGINCFKTRWHSQRAMAVSSELSSYIFCVPVDVSLANGSNNLRVCNKTTAS